MGQGNLELEAIFPTSVPKTWDLGCVPLDWIFPSSARDKILGLNVISKHPELNHILSGHRPQPMAQS